MPLQYICFAAHQQAIGLSYDQTLMRKEVFEVDTHGRRGMHNWTILSYVSGFEKRSNFVQLINFE